MRKKEGSIPIMTKNMSYEVVWYNNTEKIENAVLWVNAYKKCWWSNIAFLSNRTLSLKILNLALTVVAQHLHLSASFPCSPWDFTLLCSAEVTFMVLRI